MKIRLAGIIAVIFSILLVSDVKAYQTYEGTFYAAEEINGVYYYKHREDTPKYTYKYHNFHEQAKIYRKTTDNSVVYCVESWEPISGAPNGSHLIMNKKNPETWEYADAIHVEALAYYGYGYKEGGIDHTDPKWYAITQYLIWKTVSKEIEHYFVPSISSSTPIYPFEEEINELNNLVAYHTSKPLFEDYVTKSDLVVGVPTSFKDVRNVLKNYQTITSDTLDVKRTGEDELLITSNIEGNQSIYLKQSYNYYNKQFIYYKSDNYQDMLEPGNLLLNEYRVDFTATSNKGISTNEGAKVEETPSLKEDEGANGGENQPPEDGGTTSSNSQQEKDDPSSSGVKEETVETPDDPKEDIPKEENPDDKGEDITPPEETKPEDKKEEEVPTSKPNEEEQDDPKEDTSKEENSDDKGEDITPPEETKPEDKKEEVSTDQPKEEEPENTKNDDTSKEENSDDKGENVTPPEETKPEDKKEEEVSTNQPNEEKPEDTKNDDTSKEETSDDKGEDITPPEETKPEDKKEEVSTEKPKEEEPDDTKEEDDPKEDNSDDKGENITPPEETKPEDKKEEEVPTEKPKEEKPEDTKNDDTSKEEPTKNEEEKNETVTPPVELPSKDNNKEDTEANIENELPDNDKEISSEDKKNDIIEPIITISPVIENDHNKEIDEPINKNEENSILNKPPVIEEETKNIIDENKQNEDIVTKLEQNYEPIEVTVPATSSSIYSIIFYLLSVISLAIIHYEN